MRHLGIMRMAEQSWTVGNLKIIPFVETDAGPVIEEIITDANKDTLGEIGWLVPHFADSFGHLKAVVQSFLVVSGSTSILVDTCVGNDKSRIEMADWNH